MGLARIVIAGNGLAGLSDPTDRLTKPRVPLHYIDPQQHSGGGCGHLDNDFVRLDLVEDFILADGVPRLLPPCDDAGFFHGDSGFGNSDWNWHMDKRKLQPQSRVCFNNMHLVAYNATGRNHMKPTTCKRFQGKTAIITGASRGIGRGIGVRLASEGAYVVINYAKAADERFPGAAEEALRLARETGGDGEIREADVADTASMRDLIRDIASSRGLDILVNNAGICPMLELFEITEEAWDRVHDINLRATFFASQEAARLMIEKKTRGRIVCISSIAAEIGTPTQIHYGPTKGGINALVKAMASVLGPHGITINAVMPGDIATDISREWDEANPEEIQRYIERCPVRRRGTPEDIAAVTAFLASPEAAFVNGSAYLIDGGLTAVM